MLNEQQLITASNETYLPNTSGLITADRVRAFNNDDLIPTIFDISASLQNTINGIVAGTGFATTQSLNALSQSFLTASASFDSQFGAIESTTASLNTYTQSINTYTQSMNQFTQSYNTGSFTGSFAGDGSKLFGVTASIAGGIGILDEGVFQGNAITLNFTGSNITASVVGNIATINVANQDVNTFLSKSTFEAYTASVDLTFATDTQLSASASTLQNNINSLSQSVAVTDLAQSSSIAQLLTFSSSLDATYATDAQLSASVAALSASVTVTTNGLSSSIGVLDSEVNALQSWSSSLDTIYATDTQLSASASTLQNNINTLSSSIAVTDLAQSASIAALQQFSSSLDSTFATDTQLSASASTLQNNINAKLDSSSFNSYTQSNDSKVNSLINATGSYVTEAESGSFVTSVLAGITPKEISVIKGNGTTNTITVNNVDSASFATTASFALNATPTDVSMFLSKSVFDTYTGSAALGVSASINSATQSLSASLTTTINGISGKTGSYATTGSNTFRGNQIISGNLNISGNITATSGTFQYVLTVFETASIIYSSGSNQLGDELSDVQTLSGSVKVQGGLTVNGTDVLLVGQTASYASASISSSYALSASFASNSSNTISSSFAQTASIANNLVVRATNDNASTLVRGTVVRITGANGDNPLFNSASWDNDGSSANSLGILQSDVVSGATGSIVVTGVVIGVDTDGMTAGNILYLSSSGQFTNVQPQAPLHIVTLGEVLRVQQNNGSIFVNISNGWELNELHNVRIVSASQGDILAYNSASQLWENSSSVELGLTTTSSFNSYTASQETISASFNSRILNISGTYATTASNTFTGLQTLNGGLDVNSTTTLDGAVTASKGITVQDFVINTGSGGNNNVAIGVNSLQSNTGGGQYNVAIGTQAMRDASVGSDNIAIGRAALGNTSATISDNVIIGRDAGYEVGTSNNTIIGATAGKNALRGTQNQLFGYNAGNALVDGDYNTIVGAASGLAVGGEQAASASNHIILSDGQGNIGLVVDSNEKVIIDSMYATGSITASNFVGTASYSSFALTASYAMNASATVDTGSLVTTSSFNSYTQSAASGVSASINSATQSLSSSVAAINALQLTTASATDNVITFTKGDGSTFPITVATGSGVPAGTVSSSAQIAAFGYATTGSNTFIGNQTITGSVILSSSADIELTVIGNTIVSGNLVVTGSNINLEVDAPALSVGVTNVKTVLDATASGVVSSTDITRLGAGPTGDLSGVRLQTLSGSDTTGDTLLSRVSTGVNRHTSTAMTGSVVNSTITSTWATGSAGGRVAYSSTVNANAQSASATLTLNAGAGATLAGGTASLAAGLIRIGTNVAHTISTTGSFGPMILVGPLNQPVFAIRSGSFEVTTPQGSGSFYTNLPITSSGMRLNGLARFSGIEVIGLVGANGSGSVYVENAITASVVSASQFIGTIESASFATTASFALNAQSINTSSFATTGSNSFVGTQSVNGTITITGSLIVTNEVSTSIGTIRTLTSVVSGDSFTRNLFVSGNSQITGSAPTHTFLSASVNYSGSLLTNATDTYPSVPQGNFVVTLSSASMATLLSGGATNANTIYFVI
jgi:epidermal growth factor receptor substrate 15